MRHDFLNLKMNYLCELFVSLKKKKPFRLIAEGLFVFIPVKLVSQQSIIEPIRNGRFIQQQQLFTKWDKWKVIIDCTFMR